MFGSGKGYIIWKQEVKTIRVPTTGSNENLRQLEAGQVDLAITPADVPAELSARTVSTICVFQFRHRAIYGFSWTQSFTATQQW